MKLLRFLFLVGAVAAVALVVRDYRNASRTSAGLFGVDPEQLTADVASRSGAWTWDQSSGGSAKVSVSADGFRQAVKGDGMELSGVRLRIYEEDEKAFNRVETDAAVFDIASDRFESSQETVITLGVPADDPESRSPSLTRIVTPSAVFDTKGGAGHTDGVTEYFFDGGRGRSVGAAYDSARKYFHMQSQARVERFASGQGGTATVIEAGELFYLENDQRVDLRNGTSLVRGGRRVDAAEATVTLAGGVVRRIDALDATGVDSSGGRQVQFETPALTVYYSEKQTIERALGSNGAKLRSTGSAQRLEAEGREIDMLYRTPEGASESELNEAFLKGGAEIRVAPIQIGAERRKVTSEWIRLKMKPGGENLEYLETLERGRAELIQPTSGTQRTLHADRIRADYGPTNVMTDLAAQGAVELTSRPADQTRPPLKTWSGALEADLDPATGEMRRLKQWTDFRFVQGDRSGDAGEAEYDPSAQLMTLSTRARILDTAGSVSAHRIVLNEAEGRLRAEGNVSTVYQQASGDEQAVGLFASSDASYATALKMTSDDKTGIVEYSGDARLWQGANRIEADLIRIDRKAKKLHAEGAVVSFLHEEGEGSLPDSLVEVRADHLDYSDAERVAQYRGSVRFKREALRVESEELDAQLAEDEGGQEASTIETAEARGSVRISDVETGREGRSIYALYRPGDSSVVLRGKPATVSNAQGEETRGAELTYLIDGDSLRVSGEGKDRAYTYRRKR